MSMAAAALVRVQFSNIDALRSSSNGCGSFDELDRVTHQAGEPVGRGGGRPFSATSRTRFVATIAGSAATRTGGGP
jgi:hypothetical protein